MKEIMWTTVEASTIVSGMLFNPNYPMYVRASWAITRLDESTYWQRRIYIESSAIDRKNGTKVVIRKLARPFQSAIHAKRTYRELRMLKHMNHENVIGFLDVFTPAENFEDFQDVYLVAPLMGADLNNIIKTQKLSDDHVQFLIYQILRALKASTEMSASNTFQTLVAIEKPT